LRCGRACDTPDGIANVVRNKKGALLVDGDTHGTPKGFIVRAKKPVKTSTGRPEGFPFWN
jgi:hypothetical protein